MFVDGVLGSHVVVCSPVKVELRQIVILRQSTGGDANRISVVDNINLNYSHQITHLVPRTIELLMRRDA